MGVNGKQKGNTFERTISNYLSDHFSDHLGIETGFRRNIDSGSFFGGKNQYRVQTHLEEHQSFGDILTPTNFKFEIECKAYKTPPALNSIVTGNYKKFDEWIAQAEQDAQNANKGTMLIIKFNNVKPVVLVKEMFDECVYRYKEYYAYEMNEFFVNRHMGYFFIEEQ